MLICPSRINTTLKLSAGEIELAIFEKLSSWPSVCTFQENHVYVLPNQSRLSVEQNEAFAPCDVGDLVPPLLMREAIFLLRRTCTRILVNFP